MKVHKQPQVFKQLFLPFICVKALRLVSSSRAAHANKLATRKMKP